MINSQTHPQLTDYALGLLNPAERKAVEDHASDCVSCQQALAEELQFTTLVQTTIQTATHVENGRLQKLMPTIPTKKQTIWQRPIWQRQLASICVLAILLFGGLGVYQSNFGDTNGFIAPTSLSITATNTALPTETTVANEPPANVPTSTAVAGQPDSEQSIAPQPAATPIAFVNATN
ncbi:MAG: zf-HC2 domain-containing protein [Chloroflexota bacterium]